jgi:uncharacterized protein
MAGFTGAQCHTRCGGASTASQSIDVATANGSFVRLHSPPRCCSNRGMNRAPALPIRDNAKAHRLEAELDGALSFAEYRLGEGTIAFTHTLVPESMRGRGIATQLVEAGLAAARSQQRGVIPQCSMFADYMRSRPETHALLAPAGRAMLNLDAQ